MAQIVPPPPPRLGMSEEIRLKKLAAAKKKVKRAGSRLPDPAQGPSDGWAVARVCAASEAHGASPSEPVGSPPKSSHQSHTPTPRQPSPRPRLSLPGDFGPVTPGTPGSALVSCRQEPDLLGSLGSVGSLDSQLLRTSVRALRSLPPPRSGDWGIHREEWNVVTSQSPSKPSLQPRARCSI